MRNSLIFILVSMILFSCNKYSKTDTGLRYQFLKRSNNKTLPVVGEFLQCRYSISNSEDSVIYNNFNSSPERIMLTMPTHKNGDIMEAFAMMAEGDSAQFLINADSFFYKTRGEMSLPTYVKQGTDLKFIIKLEKRLTAYQKDSLDNVEKIARWKKEIEDIIAYSSKNGLEMKLDSSTGLRYQFHSIQGDTAKKIVENSKVKFHFIGKLFDNTEFFNSYTSGSVQVVTVNKELLQPIGMYEMLTKMKQGEKATFILPFDLGFGAKGIEGIIPPFSPLVYEVNILKVEQ